MRQDWLRCSPEPGPGCFFYDGNGVCLYDPGAYDTLPNSFCSKWVCAGCGGDWDDSFQHGDCLLIEVEFES
jgi:hypothetical protein